MFVFSHPLFLTIRPIALLLDLLLFWILLLQLDLAIILLLQLIAGLLGSIRFSSICVRVCSVRFCARKDFFISVLILFFGSFIS